MDRTQKQQSLRWGLLLLLALVISGLFFQMIHSFIMSVLLAAIFAGIAQPLYQRLLTKLNGRANTAAGLTLLAGVLVIVLPVMGLMAVVVRQAADVSTRVAPWVEKELQRKDVWETKVEEFLGIEQISPYRDQVLAKAGELGGRAAGYAMANLAAGTKGTARFFLLFFVMLYALFYFVKEGPGLLTSSLRLVPLSDEDKSQMLTTFTSVTRATLKGTVVIGIIQGALGGLAFAVVGIPGPVFWGVIMAVMSTIPAVGPAIVWVPAAIFLVAEGEYGLAVGFTIWCVAVVSTIDNLLRPRLVGADTKMPDVMILLGTLGGLMMFGAVGIIIGPIIAALFITVWKRFAAAVDDALAPVTPPAD